MVNLGKVHSFEEDLKTVKCFHKVVKEEIGNLFVYFVFYRERWGERGVWVERKRERF